MWKKCTKGYYEKNKKRELKECTEGYHDRKKVNKVGTK